MSQPAQGVLAGTVIAATLTTFSAAAQAISFVNDRAQINETDTLDWSTVGSTFNPFGPPDPAAFLPNPFNVFSSQGLGVQVDIPAASTPGITPPFVFQTTDPGIPTNFGDGDFILFTGLIPGPPPAIGNPGPITLTFDSPVKGVGAQLAVDDIFTFTGTIEAFGKNDELLGSFSAPGTSSTALDNSAQFFGVTDTQASISKLSFSSSVPNSAIGINQLSLYTEVEGPDVAEPSVLLGAIALLTTTALTYKKRRATP